MNALIQYKHLEGKMISAISALTSKTNDTRPMNPALAPFTSRRLPQTRRDARSFAELHNLPHAIMRCPREPEHRQIKITSNKFISADEWHSILRHSSSIHEAITSACQFGQHMADANRMLVASWGAHEAGNGGLQSKLEEKSNDAWDKAQAMLNEHRQKTTA